MPRGSREGPQRKRGWEGARQAGAANSMSLLHSSPGPRPTATAHGTRLRPRQNRMTTHLQLATLISEGYANLSHIRHIQLHKIITEGSLQLSPLRHLQPVVLGSVFLLIGLFPNQAMGQCGEHADCNLGYCMDGVCVHPVPFTKHDPNTSGSSKASVKEKVFVGKVVAVYEGDTIAVRINKKKIYVSLLGVDCPKENQPFGKEAKRFTYKLAYGKQVKVTAEDKDDLGWATGRVCIGARVRQGPKKQRKRFNKCLSNELVRAGLAWWYQRHKPMDKKLKALETEARMARRGIWSEEKPVPPWDWRKTNRVDLSKKKKTEK